MKNLKKTILAASVALAAGMGASTASAHGGVSYPPYLIFVGFNGEPAFAGEPNAMDLYAFWDKDGDASCDTDTDCVPIDTSKGPGNKVQFQAGGYVKLLYCGPLGDDDHGHAVAPAAEDDHDHEHGACDHPLAELVIADEAHPLDQSFSDPSLYNSEYFKPTVPGVYGFKVHNLKLKKGALPAVTIKDATYTCTENHFSCINELQEFPGDVGHEH